MRLNATIGFVSLMVFVGGCALLGEGAGGALQRTGEGLTGIGAVLPPPWNWIAISAGGLLSTIAGEATRRSLKNSPEGKLFGPVKKPIPTDRAPQGGQPSPSDDLAIGVESGPG